MFVNEKIEWLIYEEKRLFQAHPKIMIQIKNLLILYQQLKFILDEFKSWSLHIFTAREGDFLKRNFLLEKFS